jgi:uncharacterized linocin/CFP29 family protein
VNHLLHDLAPITDAAWEQINEEATRSLKHFLAARRVVDFDGPSGWDTSSVSLGRVSALDTAPIDGVAASVRRLLPLVELRTPFTLSRAELDAAERGADDNDLAPVIEASRRAAYAEDNAIFHGFDAAGIAGIAPSSPLPVVSISDDYSNYPTHVASALGHLRAADVDGPYAIALGPRCFTGVIETTEHGGYPVFQHLREILGGPVVWAPAVDGAVVVSQRGGDFHMTVGQDLSIGYASHDADSVQLYLEESVAFRISTPEAAVHLAYTS